MIEIINANYRTNKNLKIRMQKQLISITPQIIQFDTNQRQTFKVTNNSSESIQNCYFCLFNTNKYVFEPDNFSLKPQQYKIIVVYNKLINSSGICKQFAYLKTKNINKRIMLKNNGSNEEDKYLHLFANSSDYFIGNSRQAKINQKNINEKLRKTQSPIPRKNRRFQQPQSNNKSRTYLQEINQLQIKIQVLIKQKQQLIMQNLQLQSKYQQYKKDNQGDMRITQLNLRMVDNTKLIQSQVEQIKYLEGRCEEYLRKNLQKQNKIKQYQIYYAQTIENYAKERERQVQEIQQRASQQKKQSQKTITKISAQNTHLSQHNKQLQQKLKANDKQLSDIKQQILLYKQKIKNQDVVALQMKKIIQIDIQRCKNQNEGLKISKLELQKILGQEQKLRQIQQQKIDEFQQLIRNIQNQLIQKQLILQQMTKQIQLQKQQLINIKTENVQLVQQINCEKNNGCLKKEEIQHLNKIVRQMEIKCEEYDEINKIVVEKYQYQVKKYQEQIEKLKLTCKQYSQKIRQSEQLKMKNSRRVQKYQKQLKRQRRYIKDRSMNELRWFNEQQNKVSDKYNSPYKNSIKKSSILKLRKQLQQNSITNRTQSELKKLLQELSDIKYSSNILKVEIKKLKQLPGLKKLFGLGQEQNQFNQYSKSALIHFLKEISNITIFEEEENISKQSDIQKQIAFMKRRLNQLEKSKDRCSNICQQSSITSIKDQNEKTAIQFIRQQMRIQYKKMYESLQLSNQINQNLKTKIYLQYRSRIIDAISKKNQNQFIVGKIQNVLERFVDGLGNVSHQCAILAKQVKLKQQARKQVSHLKNKLLIMNKSPEKVPKKHQQTPTPEPSIKKTNKLFEIQKQKQWLDNIKMQTKYLTLQSQNIKLLQEMQLWQIKGSQLQDQLRASQDDIQQKQNQIDKLKKQLILIKNTSQNSIQRLQKQLNEIKNNCWGKYRIQKIYTKDKQNNGLREQISDKKQQIRKLKQKIKVLQAMADENKKNIQMLKQKQKKLSIDQLRMHQTLKQFKQNNRELRTENTQLKTKIQSLSDEVCKKNTTLKRIKSQKTEYKINELKNTQQYVDKLSIQNKLIKKQLNLTKSNLQQYQQHYFQFKEKQNFIQLWINQQNISENIMESTIRTLVDLLNGIYCSLNILARKRGTKPREELSFQKFMGNPEGTASIQIRQIFDDLIESLSS